MIADAERIGLGEADRAEIGNWVRTNVDRVNILLPASLGVPVLTLENGGEKVGHGSGGMIPLRAA